MDILLHQLVPFKSLSYFTSYFATRQAIQVEQDKTKIRQIYALCLVTISQIFYNFHLVFRPSLSPSSAMLHFAVFHYVDLPSSMYLVSALAETLSLYYLYLLYLNKGKKESAALQFYDNVVLVKKEKTVFWLTSGTAQATRQLLLKVVNIFQVFTLVLGNLFNFFCKHIKFKN